MVVVKMSSLGDEFNKILDSKDNGAHMSFMERQDSTVFYGEHFTHPSLSPVVASRTLLLSCMCDE